MGDVVRWIALARAAEGLNLGGSLRAAGSVDALLEGLRRADPAAEGGSYPRGLGRLVPVPAPSPSDHRAAEAADRLGIRAVPFGAPEYPAALASIADPPPVLFVRGAGDLTAAAPRVAVVGARSCTARGARVARELSAALSRAGVTVVSGLARGIDAAGHDGALDGPGTTWAVLAGGLDRATPQSNAGLYARLLERGLALSEVPPLVSPEPFRFPRRNRVIAGLVRAVVVVEAEERSGALITARLASEEGREVLAVPGPVDSTLSRGPHRLIRAGGTLVEDARDLLDSLGLEGAVLARGDAEPWRGWFAPGGTAGVDELLHRTGLPIAALQGELLRLELHGRIVRTPSGDYRPAAP